MSRITPASRTSRISSDPKFYSPVPEPPIDYTIRVKPTSRKALSNNTSDKSESRLKDLKSLEEETEVVLDDLDSVLMSASVPFEELRQKVEKFNINYKPYKENTDLTAVPSVSREPLPRARSKSKPRGNGVVPVFSDEIIHDIKSVNRGVQVKKLNEEHAMSVEEMHRKTLEKVNGAKIKYSAEHFLPLYEKEGVPSWKQHLLAEKKSKATMKKFEEEAWEFYEKWKKIFYPKSSLQPVYQFSGRPQVNLPTKMN